MRSRWPELRLGFSQCEECGDNVHLSQWRTNMTNMAVKGGSAQIDLHTKTQHNVLWSSKLSQYLGSSDKYKWFARWSREGFPTQLTNMAARWIRFVVGRWHSPLLGREEVRERLEFKPVLIWQVMEGFFCRFRSVMDAGPAHSLCSPN